MTDFVDVNNARPGVGQYQNVIRDIAEKHVCPFCPEHIAAFHRNPMERREHWLVTDNMYPYKPTRHCVLLIHRAHIEHAADISPAAWRELGEIYRDVIAVRGIAGGTIMMRFGETRFTGASVTHLHAHLIQSNPDSPDYDPATGLRIRLG